MSQVVHEAVFKPLIQEELSDALNHIINYGQVEFSLHVKDIEELTVTVDGFTTYFFFSLILNQFAKPSCFFFNVVDNYTFLYCNGRYYHTHAHKEIFKNRKVNTNHELGIMRVMVDLSTLLRIMTIMMMIDHD